MPIEPCRRRRPIIIGVSHPLSRRLLTRKRALSCTSLITDCDLALDVVFELLNNEFLVADYAFD